MKIASKILTLLLLVVLFFSCKNTKINTPKNLPKINVEEYNIYCDEDELQSMFKNYRSNEYIPVTIEKNQTKYTARMRVRGDSSRDYDKKSLKVKITDSLSINTKRTFNFNAEYSDKSFLRSFLSSTIFKKLNYPCFSTSFSNLSINNQYHGLFVEIENMDRDFLNTNGLNPNGDLFKATKDGACLYSTKELTDNKWEKKTNKQSSMISLHRLIHEISETPAENFYNYVQKKFNYPMLIDFLAINAFIANGSTYYHNYYLYRDQEGDGKWILLPWDLDKTISYYDWKPYRYHATSSDWENDNALIEKCFLNKQIFNDFKNRIEFIDTIINYDFYNPIIQNAIENLQNSILRDSTNQIDSQERWKSKIQEEYRFLNNRGSQLLLDIKSAPQPFKVHKTAGELSIPFNISWTESANADTYELWISSNFLFPDSITYKFETTDTFKWITDSIPYGQYYWKVLAKNKNSYTEGFNSKNTFLLRKGTILSERISSNMHLTKEQSPYRAKNDITVDANVTINIDPGVTILMEENVEIFCHGSFNARGIKEDPIHVEPLSSTSYFNSLYFYQSPQVSFNYVELIDGVVNSKHSVVKMKNTSITIRNRPMQIGEKRPSVIWGWHGNIILDSISLLGSGKGEGINISYADAKITNSTFYNTPDAIELINVDQGEISYNTVMFSPDDAIDLNDCSNVIIKENTLLNNIDKGISIGTDWNNKFVAMKKGFKRKSSNIQVNNNYILGNNVGLSVKDSSFVSAKNNIISFNKIGVQLYKKHENYLLGGVLKSEKNDVNQNNTDFSIDSLSSITGEKHIDSNMYIKPTENSFILPSLIKYELTEHMIILKNNSNICFELDGFILSNENNENFFKFYKNHQIGPKESLKIGSTRNIQQKNYFYTDRFNMQNFHKVYLKDQNNHIILLTHE